MAFASTVNVCRDRNEGKYSRDVFDLPTCKSVVYVTTNFEIGSTDLLHYHENSHLSFLINGGIIDKRGAAATEKYSGDLVFFHAGEPHRTIYTAFPAKSITLELESSFLKDNLLSEEMFRSSVTHDPAAKFTLLKIYRELLIGDRFSESSVEMLMLGLIANKNSSNDHPAWLMRVLKLLNDSWNEPLSLKDLSRTAGVHPVTISKHFSKYTNCTLGEYRRRLKIERSLGFIKEPDLSLTNISYKCGFFDQSHFTRTFKDLTGFIPRQYRSL